MFRPQAYNEPSVFKPKEEKESASTVPQSVAVPICAGRKMPVVLPFPNLPLAPPPQAQRVLFVLRAKN
ncbi:hypothetical protein [Flavobacterium tegetincola]|uniref:hypothetical protein n=1 Tax=Flavobacterium tegetincola TaxID=150172 RepID=UPI00054DF63C|nr:hypothetical protein [Flavobacterium tegetincola]